MSEGVSKGRELVYNAVIYGLGATLGDLAKTETGAKLVEELHKSFGKYLAEYLRLKGISYEHSDDPKKLVENILNMFLKDLDFGKLETLKQLSDGCNWGVWKDLLGQDAYDELAKKYSDPFLACPLNAVIRYELEKMGYTLVVHGSVVDHERQVLESWEEVRKGTSFLPAESHAHKKER